MVMVYLKNILIILVAFFCAFILNEILTRYAIGYPTYGLDKKVAGIRSSQGGWQNLWQPYSEYWNVEGGNIIEKRNNYGLPGSDIIINDSSKIVFLLGDSYLESLQVKKDFMATTVFQKLLLLNNYNVSVINLAYSGHDPYDLYYRAKYFNKIFQYDYIILVLESDNIDWLKRHNKLDFKIPEDIGQENTEKIYTIQKQLRNASATINLFAKSLFTKSNTTENENNEKTEKDIKNNENIDYKLLEIVLLQYFREFNDKFILIDISSDTRLSSKLNIISAKNKINYIHKDLMNSENRILAHFNEKGNSELGKLIFESFIQFNHID